VEVVEARGGGSWRSSPRLGVEVLSGSLQTGSALSGTPRFALIDDQERHSLVLEKHSQTWSRSLEWKSPDGVGLEQLLRRRK
jgi:hypothetical protein